jgi:DNA-binding transcriptional LysR family regulator
MGSREAVREAVAQGLGLGIVADTAYVADPRLRAIALTGPELYTHAHIICLKERKNARLLAHFLSLADTMKDPG